MIDDLEESLCGTGLVDLIRDMLHTLGVARKKVRKVNDGGRLERRHVVKIIVARCNGIKRKQCILDIR